MLRILLATSRREAIPEFVDELSLDPGVSIELVASGAEALCAASAASPHLLIIDSELPDMGAMSLATEILRVDAMVNTAVVSALSDEKFHEAGEGLGILARLPRMPGRREAGELLRKLRSILGLIP